MRKIKDKNELLSLFKDKDQDSISIPVDMKFPLGVKDQLIWSDQSGYKSFLVFKDLDSDVLYGAVFKRANSGTASNHSSSMCDWCHRVGSTQDVSLYTVELNDKHSVGTYICDHLSCRDHIEASPGTNEMRETLRVQQKIERLQKRIGTFLKRNIF